VLHVVRTDPTYLGELRLLVVEKDISMGELTFDRSEASMNCNKGDIVYPAGGSSAR